MSLAKEFPSRASIGDSQAKHTFLTLRKLQADLLDLWEMDFRGRLTTGGLVTVPRDGNAASKSTRFEYPHQPAAIAIENNGQHDNGTNDYRLDVVIGAQKLEARREHL